MSSVLAVTATYTDLADSVTKILDTYPLEVKDKTVLLKPNALRGSYPEAHVTTHPALVREVRVQLERRGARVLVGDNPGGGVRHRANRRVFERTGLLEAAGDSYINLSSEARRVSTGSEICPEVVVSSMVLEADLVISLPKFKTHGLTGLTGALKNSYGFLPGGQKGDIHVKAKTPHRFAVAVVDIFALRPPDLVVVDAVVGMQGDGPNTRDLIYIGQLLAGTDAVAVDAVMGHMMGIDPEMMVSVREASRRGLGERALEIIDLRGEILPLEGFRLPSRFRDGDPAALHQERKGHPSRYYPFIDGDLCDECLTCVQECPAGALTPGEGVPSVDKAACVACFCCQELCPRGALLVREGEE